MKKTMIALAMVLGLTACKDDASVVSHNISKAADNFEITRRIVFYNGITGDYMLEIVGLCSQEPIERRLAVTCKVGPTEYKKHFLGLSDNVTYFSEQIEGSKTNPHHYRVTFKPSTIIPNIELR